MSPHTSPSMSLPLKRRILRRGAMALLLLSLFVGNPVLCPIPGPGRAWAAEKPKPYALIFGTVWDPDSRPMYGIKVKIRREGEKRVRWELYSNHTGEFAQRVPPGPADYVVWADVKGVKLSNGKHLQPGPEVKVHIDGDERSDIGLHLTW